MYDLINFLIRHNRWFVFIFYAVVSCILLFNNNPYQQHVYLTSANRVASSVYKGSNNLTSYIHLRDINEDLQLQCAELEQEIITLREQVRKYREAAGGDTASLPEPIRRYNFIIAHVINNSVARPNNFITIDKGWADGVKEEMGVMDQNGIVGVVNVVSEHSARIISLLNPSFRLSCKIKGDESFGSLVWAGGDPSEAVIEELPRHTVYHPGDTIVTSGYSALFPEGIPVGRIIADGKRHDENFFKLKVELFTDFTRLSTVKVIENNLKEELSALEKTDDQVNGNE